MLQRSMLYSQLLTDRIQQQNEEAAQAKPDAKRGKGSKKRARDDTDEDGAAQKRVKADDGTAIAREDIDFEQPKLVTGAKLRDYQLAGRYGGSLNGILADEMGLGKTAQVISFISHLLENGVKKPFLIVCPLSVLHNWGAEFEKFAPTIPACCYYGTRDERAELRRTVLRDHYDEDDAVAEPNAGEEQEQEKEAASSTQTSRKSKGGSKATSNARRKSGKQSAAAAKKTQAKTKEKTGPETTEEMFARVKKAFPVVITTYEIIMRDSKSLGAYDWGYIIVDEGHRLKNMNCKLIQEIKKYSSANRMIITGTPLHNNLAELWSLLNFILPDIFSDLEMFQSWFNFDNVEERMDKTQTSEVVNKLHSILAPFLLRRLKTDVETNLPPKKEYVLYAPLTAKQKELYQAVLDGALREWLISAKSGNSKAADALKKGTPAFSEGRKLRKKGAVDYDQESDDDEYLDKLAAGKKETLDHEKAQARVNETLRKNTVSQVNRMHLKNVTMQLRKVACHPFAFDWPVDHVTREYVVNEELVDASGKMMMLERLLEELFKRGHRVLLFSQFTTMLDIIEDWAVEYKHWDVCRIDGSTAPDARRAQMDRFNGAKEGKDPRLFLLSTRAGGLGINLVSADTVIFYDQDWNPQMDLQAQDRAHRIGQTKPVLIFRLVSQNTIETKIMARASEKRKLEALVIAKGKFKHPGQNNATAADLASSMLRFEEEQVEVVGRGDTILNDEQLDVLLDRSPEVFTSRGKGWSGEGKGADAKAGATFEVFETAQDEGNDALANMLGEESLA
ncbi:hypothetical protein EXIGLDRAFT_737823 [Exidia glandulosa HHB12029]|uniref:SNF2 family DNA-dependent ATPase n=1 Tax=Exidia glandulosa HHB12029 TaxID=1314781 RepID=A0A165QW35_EXIGL|nr:hypothetical protein EXIGLDRAFT_737823 [Exidia glandulosa HHB12029]